MNRNYQKELEKIIREIGEREVKPSLLLHACCAPCSSYCLEYLAKFFDITIFYFNPNIAPKSEFDYRVSELRGLLRRLPEASGVKLVVGRYDYKEFLDAVRGYESEPERGERCTICYRLRLEESAKYASEHNFDYFTTTLSISPYKDAIRLNSIGEELAGICGTAYLVSDFKKNNGYKRSIELSAEYNLYRQNYCGCAFSKAEAEEKRNNNIEV
jgi:hypothetical protein